MYDIFRNPYSYTTSQYTWPEFAYIRKTYLRSILTLEDYYHNRIYAVKSHHFLINLLKAIDVPIDYHPTRFIEVCEARLGSIVKMFNITSDRSYGKIHDGIFYGPDNPEIILSVEDWFDAYEVMWNWKNISAVETLWHSHSDLNLLLPNGKRSSTDTGLAVIAIHIPKLCLQYRQFCLDQRAKVSERNSLLTASHFIHMYVLPNMLGNQTDIVILNRLLNLYYGRPMGKAYFRHSIAISDYSAKVDKVLWDVLDYLKKQKHNEIETINSIPTVFRNRMINTLSMPDIPPTRQVWWALLLARLPMMGLIIDIGKESDSLGLFKTNLNTLQIDLTRLNRENIWSHMLGRDLYFDIQDTIDKILAS